MLLCIHSPGTGALNHSGKDLMLLGNSAQSLGRGGTGIGMTDSDLFFLNPASIAALERMEFNLNYVSPMGKYGYSGVNAVIPTSYGSFGLGFNYLSLSQSRDTEKACLLSLGNARDITRKLMLGAALDFLSGEDSSSSVRWFGASMGAIYMMGPGTRGFKGFGIFEPSLGVNLRAGIRGGTMGEHADLSLLSAGYSFLFYRDPVVHIRFFNDISSGFDLEDFPVKCGLESTIAGSYVLRAGIILPPEYRYCRYTLGAGYRLYLAENELRLNYGLGYHNKTELTHSFGLSFIYGRLDREPPVVRIGSSEKYLSPNYDGINDFCIFTTSIDDKSRIRGWKLRILDSDGREIREYRLSEREMDESAGIRSLVRKLWSKKESLVVPKRIYWDGTDARGKIVPDGKYTWTFLVWDERDNISPAISGIVHVDNTHPEIELIADDTLFSPNGDGRKDLLIIRQSVKSSPDDQWKAEFAGADGTVVRTFSWKGNEVPQVFKWNGKDGDGNNVPEGLYTYTIQSRDRAGNSARRTLRNISLTRKYETADISCASDYVSLADNGEVRFFMNLSKTAGLESWKVLIENSEKKTVMEIPGTKEFQRLLQWNGRNAAGVPMKDGIYYYTLQTTFDSGNTPASFTKMMVIDSTPPETELDYSPALFSPDGDGENDILTLYTRARDPFGIRRWTLDIRSRSGEIFKSFSGRGMPAPEIKWDGMNHAGELVESAADYLLEFHAVDMAGNMSVTKKRLPVDVLVTVVERGLKIRISNIEFAFDSARLTPRAFPILNRVAELLKKYSAYHVLIEGHTDDIGEEEYNLTLSEERAGSVRNYLTGKGIEKTRLDFRGMGETAPFLPNTNTENRRRNRRVEFLLIKKDMYER